MKDGIVEGRDEKAIRQDILAHGVSMTLLEEYKDALSRKVEEVPATAEGYIEMVHRHIREIEGWKARAIPCGREGS